MDIERIDLAVITQYAGPRYSCVVYGLIDPAYPDLVAYVGRSLGHVLGRYQEHLRDGVLGLLGEATMSRRVQWLTELRAVGATPGLVLIEQCRSKRRSAANEREYLAARESFWIADFKSRGEAWVNQTAEIWWEHREKAPGRSRAS